MNPTHDTHSANARRAWIMILCCLIPVVALTMIFAFRIPVAPVLAIGLLLLCPLGPLLMMRLGGHNHDR